jgi:succinyl-CoA synthetase beta subunit
MKLYEHEGKALLSRYGVAVPRGSLITTHADPDVVAPGVVKAQVLTGGRGKAGGVRFAESPIDVRRAVGDLLGSELFGETVGAVLVEEAISIAEEFYLGLVIDRGLRAPLFLLSDQGGVDIEQVQPERIARASVDPLLGPRVSVAHVLAEHLGRPAAFATHLWPVLEAVYALFADTEAELVEVNPLALDADGRWVALDAKVVLDDKAAARREEFRPLLTARRGFTPWERQSANLGMSAVELGGKVLVIAGGAGASMATADLVAAHGMTLAGVVDLSGGLTLDPDASRLAMRALASLGAPVVLYNAFTQVAHCDIIADAIVDGFGAHRERVVVRMKGNRSSLGRQKLAAAGFRVEEELSAACEQVLRVVASSAEDEHGHLP